MADDGTVIIYRQAGEGDPLLLVHGAAADARQWSRLLPLLTPRFNVVVMDRRGRGGSGPQRPGHSLEDDYGDIVAVARSIGRPLYLLGHSSGARYALHAAVAIPDLAGLILYEPPAPERLPDATIEALDRLKVAGDRRGILVTFLVDVAGNGEEVVPALEQRPVWPIMVDNALTLPAELAAARRYRFDPEDFARLCVPTLLLMGGESGPELGEVVDAVARALPSSTVVTLPGQGHGAMFSAPELLAAEIGRFVDRLSQGTDLGANPQHASGSVGQYEPMPSLQVLDHGEPVSISFPDLLKYHGRSSIGGVAHGFKVLERALPLLAGGQPPERYDVSIETAFPGPGARDAFEMVTRAVTGDRYRVVEDLGPPDAAEGPEGRYFFRVSSGDTVVDLALRGGLIDDAFIPLMRKQVKTQADEQRVAIMKQEMANRLMSLTAEQVYDAQVRS